MRLADISGALAIAALLTLPAGVAELFRGVDNRGGESLSARNAIAQAKAEQRRDAAARAICTEERGENSAPVWQADGSMRCANKRGVLGRSRSHSLERQL